MRGRRGRACLPCKMVSACVSNKRTSRQQEEQEEAVEDEVDEEVVAGLVVIGRLARRPYIKCYNNICFAALMRKRRGTISPWTWHALSSAVIRWSLGALQGALV